MILRPSIVFGVEDQFFNRFARMARLSPVLPVVGPETRFQPVYVDDVAAAAEAAVTGGVDPGVYELGGPEVATFRDLMERMLGVIRRRRLIVALPRWLARAQAWAFDTAQRLSFGLFTNTLITRDQVKLLGRDNVVAPGARGLRGPRGDADGDGGGAARAISTPTGPAGSINAIQESAARLRA